MDRLCSDLLRCCIRAFQQALGYFDARPHCRCRLHTITTSYRHSDIGAEKNVAKYFLLLVKGGRDAD